jgi:hypothetical protein
MGLMEYRTWYFSFVCLAIWQSADLPQSFAQERGRSNGPVVSPAETSSQRVLRLPEGAAVDLKQQMQWLQQLQGLMAAGAMGDDSSAAPKLDPEQLSTLLNAMKQFSNLVPQGTVPPKSDGQNSELLSKMLADPAVQEQVRQLLKQFTQDGKLPSPTGAGDSKQVPIPSASNPRPFGSAPDLSSMPPAAQELMKRLLQQAGRSPNGPLNDPKPGDQPFKPAIPDRERTPPNLPEPADKRQPANASPSKVEPSLSDPRFPEFPDEAPNSNLERARKDLEAIIREGQKDWKLPPRSSEASRNPSAPAIPENNIIGAGNPVPNLNKPQEEKSTRGLSPNTTPQMPVVNSEFPNAGTKSPPMDVRAELQENGFAQTLRKLIDQAREESRVESNGAGAASAGSQDSGSGSLSGLEKSLGRLMDGLRKDAAREASQVPAIPSAPMPLPITPPPPPPSPSPSGSEPRSTAGKVFESIGNAFQEMSAVPNSPSRNTRQGQSGGRASDSNWATSQSTGPLLMLLALLGVIWYFLPRVVTAVKESPLVRRLGLMSDVTRPTSIRTRADVVLAFHQYALQSAVSAPDWWTHREVERQVADTTPALKPSIEVLANLYELARYLPDDAELTPDQISVARREFETVSGLQNQTRE